MKHLLLSTAILAASGLAASAQDMFRGQASPDEIRASDLMGMRVYASADAATATAADTNGIQDNWDDIGEVGDILLKRDGSVDAVLVDIGGFLGMGEHQVAVGMNALKFVSDSATADNLNDYFLVINADRAALEAAPDYQAGQMTADGAMATTAATTADATLATTADTAAAPDATAATTDMATTTDATAADATMAADPNAAATTDATMATDATAAATTDATMATDATAAATDRTPMSKEGYLPLGADMMTADALQGAAVYDANDDRVGEVGELLIDDQGKISDVVLDVGGFLGIGEKPVSLPMTSLDVLKQDGGDDLRVYVSQTKDQLNGMETYQKNN